MSYWSLTIPWVFFGLVVAVMFGWEGYVGFNIGIIWSVFMLRKGNIT